MGKLRRSAKTWLAISGVAILWATVLPLLPSNVARAEVVCSSTVPSCAAVVSSLTVATGGQILLANGSATVPSIAMIGAPGTGFFLADGTLGNEDWDWTANTVPRIRLTNDIGNGTITLRRQTTSSTGSVGAYAAGATVASPDVFMGRINSTGAGAWGFHGSIQKTLTESSATSFVQLAVVSGGDMSGNLAYSVLASDATPNRQALSGILNFSAVNPAGTETCPAPTDVGTPLLAANTGTLTCTWTCDTTPTNAVNLQANCVSSLTQTSLSIRYAQIVCLSNGATSCTITAQ